MCRRHHGEVTVTNILTGQPVNDSLEIGDDALAEISLILEMRRNFSMSIYKDKCMKRRVAIRMRSCRCLDAASYCNLLRQSEQELDLLKKTLTIHVSQFFRNPSMFEKLQNEVFPYLFTRRLQSGDNSGSGASAVPAAKRPTAWA